MLKKLLALLVASVIALSPCFTLAQEQGSTGIQDQVKAEKIEKSVKKKRGVKKFKKVKKAKRIKKAVQTENATQSQ